MVKESEPSGPGWNSGPTALQVCGLGELPTPAPCLSFLIYKVGWFVKIEWDRANTGFNTEPLTENVLGESPSAGNFWLEELTPPYDSVGTLPTRKSSFWGRQRKAPEGLGILRTFTRWGPQQSCPSVCCCLWPSRPGTWLPGSLSHHSWVQTSPSTQPGAHMEPTRLRRHSQHGARGPPESLVPVYKSTAGGKELQEVKFELFQLFKTWAQLQAARKRRSSEHARQDPHSLALRSTCVLHPWLTQGASKRSGCRRSQRRTLCCHFT